MYKVIFFYAEIKWKKMGLEQLSQPTFSLPEDLLNLEQSDLLNCLQVLDFFKIYILIEDFRSCILLLMMPWFSPTLRYFELEG